MSVNRRVSTVAASVSAAAETSPKFVQELTNAVSLYQRTRGVQDLARHVLSKLVRPKDAHERTTQ